ncbi:MAG: TonB-dependent receptor [Acidobacteriia bacterium]|nr:TonB-dependent receptor [Terriglobia bacterium]
MTDPQGLAVKGAKVTVTSLSTGAERSATANENGYYSLIGLAPGKYKLSIEGGANFQTFIDPELTLTIGSAPVINIQLQIRGVQQSVTVTGESVAIETTKTEVSQTVEQRRIENLPINGRNYINFTLTNSQTVRDSAPSIGAAPTSGLNMGGQRARSNEVTVDGADAVDNSVNGIRATVSQEAVQEFQMILSNYNAEYGRAMGGVVNIVSKGGSNDFHGSLFGFLRNKSIQARNAFSTEVNPVTGAQDPAKQAYTRVQAGFTLGGAIKKDKTFYFLSYETTRRQETGFSSIGANNFDLAPLNCGPGCPYNGLELTSGQANAVNQLFLTGIPALQSLGAQYAVLMGSASSVALNKTDFGVMASVLSGGSLNPYIVPGEFPLPVPCPLGQTINAVQCLGFAAVGPNGSVVPAGIAPLPASYVGLMSLRGNFPMKEDTNMWSARLDHHWSSANNSFLRVGVAPSFVNGIQVNAQNQNMGQNAASRTSLQQARDFSAVFQHDTVFHSDNVNVFRFQIARRGLHYGYSQAPGGSGPGINIAGFAYFGREPFSTVDRIERRYQFTDNLALTRGAHTFKVGADINLVQLDSAKDQIFELNFGSVINFGGLSADTFFPAAAIAGAASVGVTLPGTTGVQSYGLGIPTTFIQGIGNSKRPFSNKTFGFFAQDSWRITHRLTMNYGVRYDLELTPLLPAATAVNTAAETALKVVEGIPHDKNNFSPRLGLAWDPAGNGKTVVRAGYGIFFDHPLLAVAFNSFTAEGAMSSQLISPGGAPSACTLSPLLPNPCGGGLDSPANLNGASIFQGVLNAVPSMGYLPQEQRFNAYQANSLFTNQNFLTAGFPIPILPFTLPVAANFKYAYAQQGNLTIERELANNWKFSIGYQYTHAVKLNRPRDINSTDPRLLAQNLFNADAAGLGFSNPITVVAPAATFGPTASACGVSVVAPQVLGVLFGCPGPLAGLDGQFVGTPAFFNFFRPSGPNPSFAGLAGGYANQVLLAGLAGYPTGYGVPVPFNSVDNQESSGNSVYHGLTASLTKRFSKGFEVLSSYTWSHAIDDSTDLQTLLEPQDGRFPNMERSSSSFDQRHRWVTSAVLQSGSVKSGSGFLKHLTADTSLAPIVEFASGRPYTVLTGTDFRLDLGASQGRPSLGTGSPTDVTSPYLPGVSFSVPTTCLANDGTPFSVPGVAAPLGCDGNLGRNKFVRPNFFQFDLRLARRFPVGEKLKLDVVADAFNILNRMNVADVSPLCNPLGGCNAGQPTAALDARQFQFAVKLSW